MKRLFLFFASCFVVTFLSAQELVFPKGTYGIDHNKKLVVVPGHVSRDEESVTLNGESYRLYRSNLPVITIETDGPIVNTPAVHGTISVADTSGYVIQMHAGFKIRGTSSQLYDKKSYRVELWSDSTGLTMADTTFLGLRSDDDWNLEAMWTEPLRLRNKVANDLWREMYHLPYLETEPEALPGVRMEYVDVFLNGDYIGIYTLTERLDRKQLGLKKYNGTIRGVLYKGNGDGAPSFDSLPDYDNMLDTWDNFEWVYPNESDTVIDWSQLYSFVNFVINSSDNVFYSQYPALFDVQNAIDYYLFINVLSAIDNMGRNTFIARYKKSSVFFYAPWDLDAIIGLDADGHQNNETVGLKSNGFYDRLIFDCNTNGFATQLQTRYNDLRLGFFTQSHFMDMFQREYEFLLDNGAYERESEAWPDFVVDEGQLGYISEWLASRFEYLDMMFNDNCGSWGEEEDLESARLEVFPNPTQGKINIRFAEVEMVAIQLYDMKGRLVYSFTTDDRFTSLSVASYPLGIYTLVVNGNGWQQVEKVVLQ